MFRKTAKPL